MGITNGDATLMDSMIHDGLTCSFTGVHMGTYGNQTAEELDYLESSGRMVSSKSSKGYQAIEKGIFAEEIVSVKVPVRKGNPIVIEQDEAPRKDTTIEKLAKLAPAFGKDGTITAGNAPGVNDGAGALVLMSEKRAKQEGKEPLPILSVMQK